MAAASDPEILEVATEQNRTLISADTDFGTLLALRQASKPSFILFRQSDKRPRSQLGLLLTYLDKLRDELLAGCIVVIEDQRILIRTSQFPQIDFALKRNDLVFSVSLYQATWSNKKGLQTRKPLY